MITHQIQCSNIKFIQNKEKKKEYILVIVNSYHLQAHEQDGESNPLWVGYGDLASINSSMKQTSWKIARHSNFTNKPYNDVPNFPWKCVAIRRIVSMNWRLLSKPKSNGSLKIKIILGQCHTCLNSETLQAKS